MKLLSCHIENFGGLSDFRLRFEDDITVIMEENGWGKTTLSAFLLSMFYGLPQRGKDSARERARFLPWKGGTCGGSLTFAHRGTAYRILRTFGTSPAKDTFRLYDLQTGFASEDFSERIGEELFGIDRASFLRTDFVTSDSLLFPGSAAPDPTASIQARISGLAPGAEDLTQYEGAAKRLRKEIARLSPDRPSGELARAKSALDSLAARASCTEAAAEAVRECAARLDEEKAALVQLQRDRDDLLRRSADEAGAREAAILLDHYDSLRRHVREAGEALDPAPVEDSTQHTDKIHAQKAEYIRTRKALSKVRHAIDDASQEEAAARTALLAGACVTVLMAALGTAAAVLDIASPLLPGLFAAAALGAALFTLSRRPKQETRDCLRALKNLGYCTGSGVMCALPGQTAEDLAADIEFFAEEDLDMIGMGPYIPHPGTPMGADAGILSKEDRARRLELGLRMIAATRLALGGVNIAAATALQALDPEGREKGLLAGANVVMPNITAREYRADYSLYEGKPCLGEDAVQCRGCIERRIASIGETVAKGERGDPPHWKERQ